MRERKNTVYLKVTAYKLSCKVQYHFKVAANPQGFSTNSCNHITLLVHCRFQQTLLSYQVRKETKDSRIELLMVIYTVHIRHDGGHLGAEPISREPFHQLSF